MQARINNPALIIPEAVKAMQAVGQSLENGSVPQSTLRLVHMRASQINGCSVCVDLDRVFSANSPESAERLYTIGAWRHAPYFTEAERAALALTEAVTRLSDREDPVPDSVWNEAAKHYDERGLATLLLAIANINAWNRLNVASGQIAGAWIQSKEAKAWLQKEHAAVS